jgi:competence protein ComEC
VTTPEAPPDSDPLHRPGAAGRAPLGWAVPPLLAGYTLAVAWPGVSPGFLAAAALPFAAGALALALRAPAANFHRRAIFGAWSACFFLGAMLLSWAWHDIRVPPAPAAWADLPPRETTLTVRILSTFSQHPGDVSASGLAKITATPLILQDLRGTSIYYRVRARDGDIPAVRGSTLEMGGVLTYLPATSAPGAKPEPPATAQFHDYLRHEGVGFLLERGRTLRVVDPPSAWERWTSAQNVHFESILRRGPAGLEQLYGNVYVGLFLGKSAALDDPQRSAFTLLGVMYLFAISGLHVAIVAGTLWWCLRHLPGLPRTAGDIAALALVWLYVEITGGSPSARRAALMFTFYLVALWIGRPRGSLAAILAAGLVTLVLNPLA